MSNPGPNPYQPRSKNKRPFGNVETGHAEATDRVVNSSIELYNTIARREDEPQLHELTDMDAEGDNLKTNFTTFVQGIGNEECVKSNGEEYGITTIDKYIANVWSELGKMFPNNEALKDKGWFEDLRKSLPAVMGRRLRKGLNEDDVATKVVPVFRKSSMENAVFINRAGDDEAEFKAVQVETDMLKITEQLLASMDKDAHENRLHLNMIRTAVGRGGEGKFVTYDKMYWEAYFGCAIAKWFQLKQVSTVPTTFGYDYEFAEMCMMHSFASFWAVEDGLVREAGAFDTPGNCRKVGYVFQSLHDKNDSYTARLLTRQLKKLVPHSLKDLVSVKSLRIGAMTELAANDMVGFDASVFRGGWSTGTSRDHYVWILIAALICPMLALNGVPDTKQTPYPPSLHAIDLGDFHLVQDFISGLYVISIPYFQPGGKLRPFLEAGTASLIMHFPHVLRKYGRANRLVTKMLTVAVKAGVAATWDLSIEVLCRWAHQITEDFKENQATALSRDEILSRLSAIQTRTAADARETRMKMAALEQTNAKLSRVVVDLTREVADLKNAHVAELIEVKQLLQQLVGVNGIQRAAAPAAAEVLPPVPPAAAAAAEAPQQQQEEECARVLQRQQQQVPGRMTFLNFGANAIASGSAKDVLVGSELFSFFEKKTLKNLKVMHLSAFSRIAGKSSTAYAAAMDLAEALFTHEERKMAIACDPSEATTAKETFAALNKWVVRATAALEKKVLTSRRKAYWQGVGNVVKKQHDFIRSFLPALDESSEGGASRGNTQTLRQWIESIEESLRN